MLNLMWAPGQSDAAEEVSRNLNSREKAGIFGLSLIFGLCSAAIPMIFMGSAMGIGPFQAAFDGYAFPLIVCLAVCAWIAISLQRRLLLSTRVATDNNFTVADLNARQPFSRRDHLILGGIVALSVIIALAALIAAFLITP